MRKFCIPYIPYRSLLLSTTVLNDNRFMWQLLFIIFTDFANIDELKDENVVGAFTYLFSKLEILFSKADCVELKCVCMLRGAPLPREFKQQIRAAQELDDIFDVLDNPLYCNWLNVRLLKRIAKNIEN